MKLLLDTGVLGQICHPRKYADVRAWFDAANLTHTFVLSEIVDYELRRELLRIGAVRSLTRLDELTRELSYLPVTTSTWRRAAALWATTRNAGHVTAPPEALDGDVLLAAQAIEEVAVIVTSNVKHFAMLSVQAMERAAVPLS